MSEECQGPEISRFEGCQRLEGSWLYTFTIPNSSGAPIVFQGVETYAAGGGYSEADQLSFAPGYLANLLELYAHDFSEFVDVELGADGRFGWRDLPLYWIDPDLHPFLTKVNGRPAGFAMVKRGSYLSGDKAV